MNHVASQSKHMTAECKETMMEVQYFMARDFSLDPRLYSGIMPIFEFNSIPIGIPIEFPIGIPIQEFQYRNSNIRIPIGFFNRNSNSNWIFNQLDFQQNSKLFQFQQELQQEFIQFQQDSQFQQKFQFQYCFFFNSSLPN